MKAQELNRLISEGHSPVIIDVRSKAEFKSGHIPGAVHIPMLKILIRLAKFPHPEGKTAVLLCEHGPRAQLAKPLVARAGYAKLEMLEGHMSAWRKAGLVTE